MTNYLKPRLRVAKGNKLKNYKDYKNEVEERRKKLSKIACYWCNRFVSLTSLDSLICEHCGKNIVQKNEQL